MLLNQNAIFLECFMEELAEIAGVDALEFRRRQMADHPKSLAVLEAVLPGVPVLLEVMHGETEVEWVLGIDEIPKYPNTQRMTNDE